jgi:hypothetical protein
MESVAITSNALFYTGPETLSQFTVIGTHFNTTMDGSSTQVDIKLKRMISYHLTNTYLPTVTLLIIAEVSKINKINQTKRQKRQKDK